MRYIITYDIANDRKRTKLSTLLEAYGTRVNYSVYECELTQRQMDNLIVKIERHKLFNAQTDSLRFYYIHSSVLAKCFELSDRPDPFEEEDMFV